MLELFRYRARTIDGDLVAGTVLAETPGAAAIDLQRRSLFVTAVARVSFARAGMGALRSRQAVHAFFRSFAVLVRSGIVIRRALLVSIEYCRDRNLRESLRGVLADVEQGSSLSSAMSRRPGEFSALHSAVIGAGESAGVLDEVLHRITSALDRERIVARKLQSALVYPALVASVAAILVTFLVVRVLPAFASMFDRFGVDLPAPTRALMSVAALAASPWTLPVAAAALAGTTAAGIALVSRRPDAVDRTMLSLPAIGSILRLARSARIARMLGLLLGSGVGILSALTVVAPVAGSKLYAAALSQVGTSLQRGVGLQTALRSSGIFDDLSLALIASGEEAGRVDEMLLAVADYADVELDGRLSSLTSAAEPVLIGILGLVVSFIVFSIFLPLYALMGSIT